VPRDPDPGRARLNDHPYSYLVTKDGRVRVDRGGRTVATVAGDQAVRLGQKLAEASPDGVQDLLARATGNYRRGNERR
jgi:hypothetical protein